ncbi:MAG: multifunctional CCA tRNA nucleotidyl transferase/2'3'-cyclic phosphodiesterase/2'nucleotidase/phosphatase [Gammaproteobacteria bacterium]
MKIYLVGGAVRDKLLGLPIKEKDWVVVGASVKDMLARGYQQVGKEFPVFLHPKTREEYALARMERKTKPGYQGFEFDASADVTLEEDLLRRDLTINAMAESEEGVLIDPYHGKRDLDARVLRHVSDAFLEDPVRILRLGRFLARYAYLGFKVAPETNRLMQDMVQNGEVNALVAERVWKELERALTEKNPEQFFEVLDQCGALPILFPDLSMSDAGMQALVAAAKITPDAAIRFAALLHALPNAKQAISDVCQRYRAPQAFKELAGLTALHHTTALKVKELTAEELSQLLSALDIYRRDVRFRDFLTACNAIAISKDIQFNSEWLIECANIARSVDVQALIAEGYTDKKLADKLIEERKNKIAQWRLTYQ